MQLTVSILGPLELRDSQALVQVGGARLRALLIRLALDAGRSVSTAALVDALWGEEPPDGAANALQSLVSRLRRVLGDPNLVAATPGGYQLVLPKAAVDAHRFETLAREGRDALKTGDAAGARRDLSAALALWRGPALADVADAPFAAAPAARLDELRLAVLCERLDADLRLGRHAEALPELEALATEYPLREDIAALLIKALYAAGRQADALAAYEHVRAALADQLGIDPSKDLADIHLAVLRNDPVLTPEPPARPVRRTNIRARLTSFVGRDEEVARIGKLLEESRLVTLVGPGGAGKTRLAGEASGQVPQESTADGVWLVELAPVTDPAEVAPAVLSALGPRETRMLAESRPAGVGRDPLSHLTDLLADKQVLVILDNCEHLIDAAAGVAEHLLGHCLGLRIIATSREPLGILGESLYPVPPLAQPTDSVAAADALTYPAVKLFADRAAAVRPDFSVEADGTLPAIVEICRRLDGLPLAIELAAARLRTLPVQQIAARLGDRFRLLTGGSRTAMPRHQTLRAVVAWSWELLSDDERNLAEHLSVFPGGATVESASAVLPELGPDETFDLLSALVDKSLLQPTDAGLDSAPRFRMLETLREYGAERLAETDRIVAVRRRHARYFRDLVEGAEPHLRRAEQLVWLRRLDAERDNILAAIRFAADDQDADTAVRMAAALAWYWTLTGQNTEGLVWLRVALDTPGESPLEAHAVVRVLNLLTTMFEEDDWEQAPRLKAELDDVIAAFDLDRSHPVLAITEALGPMLIDDQAALRASVDRHLDHPDPWVGAMLLLLRGMSAENAGKGVLVHADLTEARVRFAEIGDRWGASGALNGLAGLAVTAGEEEVALDLQSQAMAMMREINATDELAPIQMSRAMILARKGDSAQAHALLEEIVDGGRRNGSETTIAMGLLGLGEMARHGGDIELAWRHIRESEAHTAGRWRGPPQILSMRDVTAALLHLTAGERPQARDRLEAALKNGFIGRDMPVLARVAVATACYVRDCGDASQSARILGAADGLHGVADQSDHDRRDLETALRAELDAAVFEDCYAAGRDGTREESRALLAHALGLPPDHSAQALRR